MCSCGSWTCEKKGWSAAEPSTRAPKQRGEHQEGALSADEELRARAVCYVPDQARQRWSSPAAGELYNCPSTSLCLLPEDVRWLNLKSAVFLFTAAEQWEEQNQEEEGAKTRSSSAVEQQNYLLKTLILLSRPHPDLWPLLHLYLHYMHRIYSLLIFVKVYLIKCLKHLMLFFLEDQEKHITHQLTTSQFPSKRC